LVSAVQAAVFPHLPLVLGNKIETMAESQSTMADGSLRPRDWPLSGGCLVMTGLERISFLF
jgi:hypothetical protein